MTRRRGSLTWWLRCVIAWSLALLFVIATAASAGAAPARNLPFAPSASMPTTQAPNYDQPLHHSFAAADAVARALSAIGRHLTTLPAIFVPPTPPA